MYREGECMGLVGWRDGLEGIEDMCGQLPEVSFIAGGDGQQTRCVRFRGSVGMKPVAVIKQKSDLLCYADAARFPHRYRCSL